MALTRNRLIGNLANATDSAASSSFLAKGATEADYQNITWNDVNLSGSYSEVSDPTYSANATLNTFWNFNNTLVASNNSNTVTTNGSYSYGTGKQSESLTLANSTTVSFTGADFSYTDATTISFWYKASSFATGHVIVADGNSTSGIYNDGSGNLGYFLNLGTGTSLGFTTLSTGTWYHMVLVLGGGLLKFYVDGTQHLDLTDMTLTGNANYTFRVGYSSAAMGMDIDQVRVYDGEISSSDVTTLYNESFVGSNIVLLDSAGITSIIDSAYVLSRQGSAVAGLDSAGITSLVDSNYVVARAAASGSGYSRYNYTATAGQTVFQDSDNSGAVLSYTSGGIMVFYNGVMLKNTADWEGTDGSSVTLVEAADSGANVSIHKWTVSGDAGGGSSVWYGDRQIISGGKSGGTLETAIDYFSAATTGNAADFGDLLAGSEAGAQTSNATYLIHVKGGTSDALETIVAATPGNSTSFGTLNYNGKYKTACSDGTYGVYCGGEPAQNTMDYITIATTGSGTDFGDLTVAKLMGSDAQDGTYGFIIAGYTGSINISAIDYFTVATPSNASDFGDITQGVRNNASCSDTTRAVRAGGYDTTSSYDINTIDYFTMATPSNASDFGDLSAGGSGGLRGSSDATKGIFSGGRSNTVTGFNRISYVTIQTTSNSSDFGDLTSVRDRPAAASGSPS